MSVGTCGCGDEAVVQRRAEVDGVRIEVEGVGDASAVHRRLEHRVVFEGEGEGEGGGKVGGGGEGGVCPPIVLPAARSACRPS